MRTARLTCTLFLTTSILLVGQVLGSAGAHPQVTNAGWTFTGGLNQPREGHTATLLPSGKVLVAGGGLSTNLLNSAELYDPNTGTWTTTGNLNIARRGHVAALLENGKVLIAGGMTQSPEDSNTAELYDVVTGTWTVTGRLSTYPYFPAGSPLPNGKFLVHSYNGAQVYHPGTGMWGFAAIGANRFYHTATPLPNGNVLVAGGVDEDFFTLALIPLASAEVYNPASGAWSNTNNLSKVRWRHSAVPLSTGQVLVVGGYDYAGALHDDAELYDPTTGTWTAAGRLTVAFEVGTATRLGSGKVLVLGTTHGSINPCRAELFDPTTRTWSSTINCADERWGFTATLLTNGKVLVAGGSTLDRSELYDPGNEFISNPIDGAQLFVRQHYLDFLNREPDPGGLAYWADQIEQCGTDARCIHERRIGVSAAFFIELEFQQTGYVVYRFYRAAYGTMLSSPTRANLTFTQFMADRAQLAAGPALQQSVNTFAEALVTRPEFKEAYPDSMSPTIFVNKLFDTASLFPFTQERHNAINALTNGSKTRAQILLDVIEIQQFKEREYNPAFVLMQYFGYLRRDPEQAGYDFWLNILNNQVSNNYRAMVCAFITSAEYQRRFGSVLTRTNQDCGQ